MAHLRRKFGIFGIIIGLLVLTITPVFGQDAVGQLCVRSFEDRNGNGVMEANEPLLMRGVSVDLLDSSSVVIDSALMEPTTNRGTKCFQNLQAGDYTVMVNSVDFTPTTNGVSTVTIAPNNNIPAVFEFGAQRPTAAPATAASALSPTQQRVFIVRLIVAALATLLVMGIMMLIGMFMYGRRRRQMPRTVQYNPSSVVYDTGAVPIAQSQPGTGPMPTFNPPTGDVPTSPVDMSRFQAPSELDTSRFKPPPIAGDDTGRSRPVDAGADDDMPDVSIGEDNPPTE